MDEDKGVEEVNRAYDDSKGCELDEVSGRG